MPEYLLDANIFIEAKKGITDSRFVQHFGAG